MRRSTPFPEDVIPLAEAAVFYALKMGGEGLNLCKHLIKAYLELRVFTAFEAPVALDHSMTSTSFRIL